MYAVRNECDESEGSGELLAFLLALGTLLVMALA